jgi:hypothetical protein
MLQNQHLHAIPVCAATLLAQQCKIYGKGTCCDQGIKKVLFVRQGQHTDGAGGVLAVVRVHVGRRCPGGARPDLVRGGHGLAQRGHCQRPSKGARGLGEAVPGILHAGTRAAARCHGASKKAKGGGSPVQL